MKVNYIDFLRKKLNTVSDEFLEKYNNFRLNPLHLKDSECKEVWEFVENCKEEYKRLGEVE